MAGRGSWIIVVSSGRSFGYSSPRGRFLVGLLVLSLLEEDEEEEEETGELRKGVTDEGWRWGEKVRMRSEIEDIWLR